MARRGAPAVAAAVQRLESSIRRYNDAEVTVATGTDSPFPLGMQHEMEVLGTIAEGQLADLVLLDANPLENIRNTRRIRHVVQGGRVVDREKLRAASIR